MSATLQRDQAVVLAKSSPQKGLLKARSVSEPWFRAQALSWVARFTDADPVPIACEAAKAAGECDDNYKRSAVRAWEIAALAERGCAAKARQSLNEALTIAKCTEPISSRSEVLILLLQAAIRIGRDDPVKVYDLLVFACPTEEHWRCKRAVRDGGKLISGVVEPRAFFW